MKRELLNKIPRYIRQPRKLANKLKELAQNALLFNQSERVMKSVPRQDWDKKAAIFTNDRLIIDGYQVMMEWETPYMHKLVEMLHSFTSGDILEVGFGMGISATEIQRLGVKSHTIIEFHPEVYEHALAWKNRRPHADITIIKDYWQNLEDRLACYDGIFFDTYSRTGEEADRKRFHFFQVASEKLLRPGGALTFYYIRPCLEPSYQDQLFCYFSKIIYERLKLSPPPDCEYTNLQYAPCILAIK